MAAEITTDGGLIMTAAKKTKKTAKKTPAKKTTKKSTLQARLNAVKPTRRTRKVKDEVDGLFRPLKPATMTFELIGASPLGISGEAKISAGDDLATHIGGTDYCAMPKPHKVRTKFLVESKTSISVITAHGPESRWLIKFKAVYEPQSIFHGQATRQGNEDNRIFGDGEPQASIEFVIASKAIADTFVEGRAWHADMTELLSVG